MINKKTLARWYIYKSKERALKIMNKENFNEIKEPKEINRFYKIIINHLSNKLSKTVIDGL